MVLTKKKKTQIILVSVELSLMLLKTYKKLESKVWNHIICCQFWLGGTLKWPIQIK